MEKILNLQIFDVEKSLVLGGLMGGWMGGWMGAKAILRIAYSNQKVLKF